MKESGPSAPLPDPEERFLRNDASAADMHRRGFLRGSLAVGGLFAMPSELRGPFAIASAAEATPLDGEAYVKKLVEYARERLQHPDMLRALRGEGGNALERHISVEKVLRTVETPILPKHVEGTVFDVAELHRRYPVQMQGSFETKSVVPISPHGTLASGGHGARHVANMFYWENPSKLLTCAHVIENSKTLRPERAVDLGLVHVPSQFQAKEEQIIRDDGKLMNADIHGSLVAVVGFDRSDGTAHNGRKTFLGTAFRIEPGFVRARGRGITSPWIEHLSHSFGLVLPPGEDNMTSVGMSGAPVFVHKDGMWKICGLYWAADKTDLEREGRTMSIGFFHGIEDIRQELKRPDLLRADI